MSDKLSKAIEELMDGGQDLWRDYNNGPSCQASPPAPGYIAIPDEKMLEFRKDAKAKLIGLIHNVFAEAALIAAAESGPYADFLPDDLLYPSPSPSPDSSVSLTILAESDFTDDHQLPKSIRRRKQGSDMECNMWDTSTEDLNE